MFRRFNLFDDVPAHPGVTVDAPPLHTDEPATDGDGIAPRTEAQRQASRQNGAKSKGPRTARGKRRSRGNAVKHGLSAKTLTPIHASSTDLQDVLRLQDRLENEFQPQGQSESALVELLAYDFMRARRAIELHEQVMEEVVDHRNPTDGMPPLEQWLEETMHARTVIEAAIDRVTGGRSLALNIRDAALVREMIEQAAERDRDLLQKTTDEAERLLDHSDEDMTLEEIRAVYRDPHLKDLLGSPAGCIERQLRTRRPPTQGHRFLWIGILKRARRQAQRRIRGIQERRQVRNDWRASQRRKQVNHLPSLETAQDYEARHRRQLTRTLKLLHELRA